MMPRSHVQPQTPEVGTVRQRGPALPSAAPPVPRDGTDAASQVDAELHRLEQSDAASLRAEWRRLFGRDPPRLSRDLILRALAFRVQERAWGGLSRASLKQLGRKADADEKVGRDPRPGSPLRVGTRLVREWHGQTHVVTVTASGFEYRGTIQRSLTQIAKGITGAHWSGRRFFGLTARGRDGDSRDG